MVSRFDEVLFGLIWSKTKKTRPACKLRTASDATARGATLMASSAPLAAAPHPPPPPPPAASFAVRAAESAHHRLYEFAKTALIKIFAFPYATVRLSSHHLVSPASLFLVAPLSHPRSSATKSGLRPLLRWRSGHRQVGRRPDRPLHRSRYTTILFLSFHFLFPFLFSLWLQIRLGFHWFDRTDASLSGISEARDMWEGQRKPYTAEFCELDPSVVSALAQFC